MSNKKTLVLGASTNPSRYSNMAVNRLVDHGHPVIPVGMKAGEIHGVPIQLEFPKGEEIDTVTLYMNPLRQQPYYEQILALHPKRIIFNPGTENTELAALAEENGIETLYACTLVMLSVGNY